jgi:hypothetical protein
MPTCDAPYCRAQADYLLPQGSTPRSHFAPIYLCVDCIDTHLHRISTSIVLPGEPCEWEQTLACLENLYDGGHDYRRDLMRGRCAHRACQEARKASAADEAPHQEASA